MANLTARRLVLVYHTETKVTEEENMISRTNLDTQLQNIHFNIHGWGSAEAKELCNVLMPGEEIDECVNGYYEAGFALLVATKDRLLLLDKKPLNYLVVEDLRFEMINEFDYGHRLIGAQIRVSTGMKTLHFTTWSQARLRRLYSYVQYRMTEVKKLQVSHQESQKTNLEQMNQQLQLFLAMQQYGYQRQLLPHYQQLGSGITETGPSASMSHSEIGLAAMKRVAPVINAYTRLPWMSQRKRYEGNIGFQNSAGSALT